MNNVHTSNDYVLGSDDAEHERLRRQAGTLAPFTERLFRDAGVSRGQRVLDVGSGVGDVAFLAASIVGQTGSVLGVDRDEIALKKARKRATAVHANNIQFLETDLPDLCVDGLFDAIVGRFVLMFLPDPAATLRSLVAHLRPGGVIVFQEASWASFYSLAGHLPLRTACANLLCSTLRRAGAKPDMQLILYRGLIECGFNAPRLRLEVPVADDADGRRWLYDLIVTLRPRFTELGIDTEAIGAFDTLAARLDSELESTRSYAPLVGLVGAWARKAAARPKT